MPETVKKMTDALDAWIRGPFVEMNCALEDLYWDQDDRSNVDGLGDDIKDRLLTEGRDLITPIRALSIALGIGGAFL